MQPICAQPCVQGGGEESTWGEAHAAAGMQPQAPAARCTARRQLEAELRRQLGSARCAALEGGRSELENAVARFALSDALLTLAEVAAPEDEELAYQMAVGGWAGVLGGCALAPLRNACCCASAALPVHVPCRRGGPARFCGALCFGAAGRGLCAGLRPHANQMTSPAISRPQHGHHLDGSTSDMILVS